MSEQYPTTPIQYSFRRAEQARPGIANLTSWAEHDDNLDVGALRIAARGLSDAFPVLRSGIPRVARFGSGNWRRYYLDYRQRPGDAAVEVVDLPSANAALSAAREPFEMATGPLARILRVTTADRDLLALSTNHVVVDAWSQRLVWAALANLYEAAVLGQPPVAPRTMSFGEYAARELERRVAATSSELLRPWVESLQGYRSPPSLRGATLGVIASHSDTLSRGKSRADPLTFTLTALTLAIASRLGLTDVLVHVPTAGRVHRVEQEIVGPLAHPLPFRVVVDDPRGDDTWSMVSRAASRFRSMTIAHASATLEALSAIVPDIMRPPSFVLRIHRRDTRRAAAGGGEAFRLTEPPSTRLHEAGTQYFGLPFTLSLDATWGSDDIHLGLNHRVSFVSPEDGKALLGDLVETLRSRLA